MRAARVHAEFRSDSSTKRTLAYDMPLRSEKSMPFEAPGNQLLGVKRRPDPRNLTGNDFPEDLPGQAVHWPLK